MPKQYLWITEWYLKFLEKDKKTFFEVLIHIVFYLFSLVYGGIVFLRNFCYDKKIAFTYSPKAKVISIGNLAWSGSGKTSFSIWLYKYLSLNLKTAILRRGYGIDEGELLRSQVKNVFEAKDRAKLAEEFDPAFEVFILDDGFQHRRLLRNLDIVIMGSREFKRKHNLIPAYFFREPLSSLARANIVIINYSDELKDLSVIKQGILKVAPKVKIYFSHYQVKRFSTGDGKDVCLSELKEKKIAAFCAIGYPQGFFNKLKETGLNLSKQIIYPDHYQLAEQDLDCISKSLQKENINYLLITAKDRYRFLNSADCVKRKTQNDLGCDNKNKILNLRNINIVIVDVELEIDKEDDLKKQIKSLLNIAV